MAWDLRLLSLNMIHNIPGKSVLRQHTGAAASDTFWTKAAIRLPELSSVARQCDGYMIYHSLLTVFNKVWSQGMNSGALGNIISSRYNGWEIILFSISLLKMPDSAHQRFIRMHQPWVLFENVYSSNLG